MRETDPFCFEYMVFSDYALNHADELPEAVVPWHGRSWTRPEAPSRTA